MKEIELQRTVEFMCRNMGFLYYHNPDSRRAVKGFPDLIIVGRSGVLYRELKDNAGWKTSEQTRWLYSLVAAGQNASVWQPSDLDSGRIEKELQAIS